MYDKAPEKDTIDAIRDEAEKFPPCMLLVRDLFSFSFAEAAKVSEKFGCNAEIFAALEEVKGFLAESALPEDQRELLVQLLSEEAEVIAYSQTTRCSVIAL